MAERHVHRIELDINEELHRAHGWLEAALERFTKRFDVVPVAYVLLDQRGTILQSDRDFARLAGVPRCMLEGSSFPELLDAAGRGQFRDLLWKCLHGDPGRRSAPLVTRLVPKAGDDFAVRLVASTYASGKPTLLMAVCDIHEFSWR